MLQATYMEIYRPVLYKQTTDISLFNFKVIYIYAIWFLVSVSQIPPEQHNLRENVCFHHLKSNHTTSNKVLTVFKMHIIEFYICCLI